MVWSAHTLKGKLNITDFDLCCCYGFCSLHIGLDWINYPSHECAMTCTHRNHVNSEGTDIHDFVTCNSRFQLASACER
jgi:hypothetical protein